MENLIGIYGIESPELEQLDGIAPDVFSTNETRRKIIPPPPPADPLQDQSMDVPLDADGSYRMIAFGDIAAWTRGMAVQDPAWISSASLERQRTTAVVEADSVSRFDVMEIAPPERFQAELLDVTGLSPSRVALLGSMADGDGSVVVQPAPGQLLPLPADVIGMAADSASSSSGESSSSAMPGFEWRPYGTCLGGQCDVWRAFGTEYSNPLPLFAFAVSLSPLMEETILHLVSSGRSLAMRFRYADGVSESGWPAWRGWSVTVRFGVNTPPPVPYGLSMIGVNVNA